MRFSNALFGNELGIVVPVLGLCELVVDILALSRALRRSCCCRWSCSSSGLSWWSCGSLSWRDFDERKGRLRTPVPHGLRPLVKIRIVTPCDPVADGEAAVGLLGTVTVRETVFVLSVNGARGTEPVFERDVAGEVPVGRAVKIFL